MIAGCRAILSLLLVAAGIGAAQAAPQERSSLPIQIKANELQADSASSTATFTGKVTARQGDVMIFSDKLVIHYSAGDQGVKKVEAFGNVRIVQGNRVGEAEHAVYDNTEGKIILDGSPRVVQGEDTITGTVIIYYVDEQRSVVTGSPGKRVDAVIHPREKGKHGAAKP